MYGALWNCALAADGREVSPDIPPFDTAAPGRSLAVHENSRLSLRSARLHSLQNADRPIGQRDNGCVIVPGHPVLFARFAASLAHPKHFLLPGPALAGARTWPPLLMDLKIGTKGGGFCRGEVVGACRVTVGRRRRKCLKIVNTRQHHKTRDGSPAIYVEWYVAEELRTVLFRRFNGPGCAPPSGLEPSSLSVAKPRSRAAESRSDAPATASPRSRSLIPRTCPAPSEGSTTRVPTRRRAPSSRQGQARMPAPGIR